MAAINLSLSLSCWLAPKWMDQRAAAATIQPARDEGQTGDATAARPPDTLALTRCAISPPLIFHRIPFTYVHAPALYNEPFIPLCKGDILSAQWHWRQCNSQLAPYTQQITRKKKENYKMMIFQSVCNL